MADKASDIPNAGVSRDVSDADARIDASADELAELDSLVSSLVEEINDATDEISRVMASDDEDTQTAMAIDSGKALSDDGALEAGGSTDAPDAPDADASGAIAEAAEDLDHDAPVDAESIDEALEKVAAELEADFDAADAPSALDAHVGEDTDAETEAPGNESGEESIAAQIDEELARAFGEEDDDAPSPEPASEVVEEEAPPAQPEPAADAETHVDEDPTDEPEVEASTDEPLDEDEGHAPEDESPADAAATEEAVHAVAEAIDRLLDEEVGDDAQDAPSEPVDEVTDDEPIDEDEAEPEAAAPEKAPPAPSPPPAKKAAPKAQKPKPDAEPAPEPKPARAFSPMGVLVGALVLANKPFASIPAGLRDTLGLAGLVTLFNAMCLWVFLLLR
jgi:hypothetical protein